MSPRRAHVRERRLERVDGRGEVLQAVGLPEACRALDISHRHGQRLIAEGKFPVPALPRVSPTAHYKFSLHDLASYLSEASTADVR